jgi:hypothetical protein
MLHTTRAHPYGPIDWTATERALGHALPADYKTLAHDLGPGELAGGLIIKAPHAAKPAMDLLEHHRGITDAYRRVWDVASIDYPFTLQPEPGGLIGWGRAAWGDSFFWNTHGHPDRWSIVGLEGRGPGWFEYPGGIAEFLVKALRRELGYSAFDGLDDLSPTYTRYD